MKNIIFIISGFLIFFSGCKTQNEFPVVNGQEIDRITTDSLFTKEGGKIKLDSIRKIYYLIRHAEKDSIPIGNPALTEMGLRRATRLADILRATRLDAIYSTFTTRTLYTVDSIADIKAMPILPYEIKNLRSLVDAVENDDNLNAVLIVGHSTSTPSLANSLAGKTIFSANFDESDYENFVIVFEKKDGQKDALVLKYKIE